jgi:hypothetical protein
VAQSARFEPDIGAAFDLDQTVPGYGLAPLAVAVK